MAVMKYDTKSLLSKKHKVRVLRYKLYFRLSLALNAVLVLALKLL